MFSARFDKRNEDDQVVDEIELNKNLNNSQKLTELDIDIFNVRFQLGLQIQNQGSKDSGWRFDKNVSLLKHFYETTELNGSSYVKVPLRSPCILKTEIDDNYCYLPSLIASLYPCESSHPNRAAISGQNLNGINVDGFDLTIGFKYTDDHNFEKLGNLSTNTFELNFFQGESEWKLKLIPIEILRNFFDKVIVLMIIKIIKFFSKNCI